MKGWRAYFQAQSTGGPWSKLETKKNTNILKLKVAKFAIFTFTKTCPQAKIYHMQMNNIVALSYITKMGSTHNKFLSIPAKEIWDYLLANGIIIRNTRNTQCWSRRSVTVSKGLQWMETEPIYFQKDLQSLLDSGHTPFGIKNISSSTSILSSETGPVLEESQEIHLSPFFVS